MICRYRNANLHMSNKSINPKLIALAKNNKVVLTPHMASATIEGRIEMGETVIVNIKTFLDGHKPPSRVLPKDIITL